MPLHGYISDYWEQGWEGYYWLLFQDGAFIHDGHWSMEGAYRIQPGDHLTIYEPSGKVRWSGIIPRPWHWTDTLRKWIGLPTPEAQPEAWLDWFRASDKLRADYVPCDPATSRVVTPEPLAPEAPTVQGCREPTDTEGLDHP